MINRSSVRIKNKEKFIKCIELRKLGHSYSEIRKIVPVAKSTINNWITLAGLNLSAEHLNIQATKRIENFRIATEASKITRKKRNEQDTQHMIQQHKKYFNDPFYNYGIALYESEGAKATGCRLSNSDYRLIQLFIKFIERYFSLPRNNMHFEIYIHKSRKTDLTRIVNYWSKSIGVPKEKFKIYWKKNKIKKKRINLNYNGQMMVRVRGEKILGSKLLAISDIILKKYNRIN